MNDMANIPGTCVHELFERQAGRTPDAVAVVAGMQRWTYRELDMRANRIARRLRRQGVARESLVAIAMRRSPLMLAALFGVWKAGGAYVPLDPDYPAERLAFMCRDADVGILLTDEGSRFAIREAPRGGAICLDAEWPSIAAEAAEAPVSGAGLRDLAYVMYTSGSTGRPKGAMITHAGLCNYLCWAVAAYDPGAGGSVPVHSSLAFDLTVTSLYVPLLAGAEVELLADAGAQELLAALRARRRALVKITPAHLELLNQQLRPEELAGLADVFVIGGENLAAERLEPWRRHAPATRLINEYGPTETVVGCCVHEVQASDAHTGSIPIGRPIADTRLHILDADLRPLPAGVAGELYIGGAGVARGYLDRPELTRERFLPDPFSPLPGARLYKTGDLARCRADGVFEYLGRLDDQVKVRGYRIELGEVEQALNGHPDVRSCAVVAPADDAGEKRLAAFVVFADAVPPAWAALSDFLRERLPEWMLPARFARLDALPLTNNGKVDRRALEALAQEEAAAAEPPATDAALGPTERMVMGIFREIFQRSDIGLFDSFFDLGGHSLSAVRLMARLRAAAGVSVPLRNLYERPTVAGLAEAIDALAWSATGPAAPAPATREVAEERTEITL